MGTCPVCTALGASHYLRNRRCAHSDTRTSGYLEYLHRQWLLAQMASLRTQRHPPRHCRKSLPHTLLLAVAPDRVKIATNARLVAISVCHAQPAPVLAEHVRTRFLDLRRVAVRERQCRGWQIAFQIWRDRCLQQLERVHRKKCRPHQWIRPQPRIDRLRGLRIPPQPQRQC